MSLTGLIVDDLASKIIAGAVVGILGIAGASFMKVLKWQFMFETLVAAVKDLRDTMHCHHGNTETQFKELREEIGQIKIDVAVLNRADEARLSTKERTKP